MLLSPRCPISAWENNFPATPSNTALTTVTATVGIHTKNTTYTTLVAATTYDSYGFWLGLFNSANAATDTSMLLDVALGAAASEVDILPNLMCGYKPTQMSTGGVQWFWIPLFIPAGARVSCRVQAIITVDTIQVGIVLAGGRAGLNGRVFTACDTYGANTADSGGTAHTPGNTGAESTAATIGTATRDYEAVMMSLGSSAITVINNIAYHWELVLDSTVAAEWMSNANTNEIIMGPMPYEPIMCSVKNGHAMQIRGEASGTAQAHDVALHCFY